MKKFYHGTTTSAISADAFKLLPPSETGIISEKGRKKRLDKVFFTENLGLAYIYAGRAVNSLGDGSPIVFRVIPMGEVLTLSDSKGATVYYADWAFIEVVQ